MAVSCAIFHLTAYELTGSPSSLNVAVHYYATQGKLTVQDIDDNRWPSAQGSTFVTDMDKVAANLADLTTEERQRRLKMWEETFVAQQIRWKADGYQPTRNDLLSLGQRVKNHFHPK